MGLKLGGGGRLERKGQKGTFTWGLLLSGGWGGEKVSVMIYRCFT